MMAASESLAFGVSAKCRLEIIDSVKVSSVAPSLIISGASQSIGKLESTEKISDVIAAYVKRWEHSHAAPLDARVVSEGPWIIVSKIIGDCLHTVQIEKGKPRAAGFVSAMNLEAGQGVAGKGFPTLYGSDVLMDMKHEDAGKRGRTLMLSNRFSVPANAEFYTKALRDQGWRIVGDHHVPMQGRRVQARSLTLAKGPEQQMIVITESAGGSHVVAQWMEKP